MKKNGPQEVTYASLYWAEDEPKVRKMFIDGMGEEFNLWCRKKYDDHRLKTDIELIHVSKADDIMTYPGLSYCMQLILVVQTLRYTIMVAGTDNSQARPYQQGLYAEVTPRVDITLPGNGSITTSAGPPPFMTYTGIFASSFPTAVIRESTITTSISNAYLNRNMFSSAPINHTAGVTGFTLQSTFTFSVDTTTAWL